MRNGTVLVSVSYRLVPYLTLALSNKALDCRMHDMRVGDTSYRLKNSQTISASAGIVFPVFQCTATYFYHCALKLHDFISGEII